MTKAQIWVAGFLAAFVFLFLLQSFTTDPNIGYGANYDNTEAPSDSGKQSGAMAEQDLTGLDLINDWGCKTCHGGNLEGTTMAPALANLSSFYDRDKLINYLRNPNSFMDQDRFKQYKEKYRGIIMPSYGQHSVKQIGKVADYLLEGK